MSFEGVVAIIGFVSLALVIVVLNDWMKPRLPRSDIGPHRLTELNQKQGFFQKLGTTFLLLVFGVLISPLLLVGLQSLADPTMREFFRYVLETIGFFYLVLIIYIWWRPRWLTYVYEFVESKLVITAYVAVGIIIIGSAIMFLVRLAWPKLR